MAQSIGYFENDVTYKEGPFVIVYIFGWRVECELKGHSCPVLPDRSIYDIMINRFGWKGKAIDKGKAENVCDALNGMVKTGDIVLLNGAWVEKGITEHPL